MERKALSESFKQSSMLTELAAGSLLKNLCLQFWDADQDLCKKI